MSVPSIDELRERALRDFAAGRSGRTLIEWAFTHAAAKARLALAERELRNLEDQERDVRYRALSSPTDAAADMVMQHTPGEIAMGRARADYALAVEWVAASETMLALLAKAPKPKPATLPRAVPAASGARFSQNGGKR